MASAIQVENISKVYQLGEIGTGTISRDIERWWALMRGKEDPFLKIGSANDRTRKGNNIVYALQDINFEVEQGKAIGIIGGNGAGKSTLLKILSRVTSPSAGNIKVRGRIASLLEVGTGFHPELTGRENIYLNGAILGMRKKEITRKLDEIVDFSGVERYVDTPVKRYSSGMYVRLAFAVAAHLDSEILIVDEVLAVGDMEFQKKCLGKMEDISAGEGRTVLFVSHNMGAIKSLCDSTIVLDKGRVALIADTNTGIREYLKSTFTENNTVILEVLNKDIDPAIMWRNIKMLQNGNTTNEIHNDEEVVLEVAYELKENIYGFRLFVDLIDKNGILVSKSFFDEQNDSGSNMNKGRYISRLTIPADMLIEGDYKMQLYAGIHDVRILNPTRGITLNMNVIESGRIRRKRFDSVDQGILTLPWSWQTETI